MVPLVKIRMFDMELKLALESNTITKSSIKSAFLLSDDAITSLHYSKDDNKIFCQSLSVPEPSFILPEEWTKVAFHLASDKAPSRPATPADIAEKGESSSRKRKRVDSVMIPAIVNGDLVSHISKYAWFYTKADTYKRSAIPLTKNLACTHRHGDNKNLKEGDYITLSSYQNQQVVLTKVVLIEDALDLIILQSESELCNKNLIFEAPEPKCGMNYILMGYSVIHSKTSHISFSTGIVASDITPRQRILGSSGSFREDSGGSCWTDDGKLLGMQVESEVVPHTMDNNGRPASVAGGRCGIVPITRIQPLIVKFLPSEKEVEWSEE